MKIFRRSGVGAPKVVYTKWQDVLLREKNSDRIMKYNKITSFYLLLVVLLVACVPPSKKNKYGKPEQDFSSELAKKIYGFQESQNFDSLAVYIVSPDPMARFCATRAFGSFVTSDAVPLVLERLRDSIFEIRAEASYVAGQLGDSSMVDALLANFEANTEKPVDHLLNLHVLEAIGKIGPRKYLDFLANSSSYPKKYTNLNEGRALAFYNYALRGMTHEKATAEMVKFSIEDYPTKTAVVAANYLHRAKDIDLEEYKFQLLQGLKKSDNPNVRMCLATAIGKTASPEILRPFIEHLQSEEDSRVVINGIRQLGNFKYIDVIDPALKFLLHKEEEIAITAAEFIKNHGQFGDAGFYLEYISKISNKKVVRAIKGSILGLINRNFASTRRKLSRELTEEFNVSKNAYEKADLISAIGNNAYLFQEVHDLSFNDSMLVVRSKGVESIGAILTDFLPAQSNAQKRYLTPIAMSFLNEALDGNDVGMIAAAAYSISKSDVEMVKKTVDKEKLMAAITKLKMPNDIEAINYCIEAVNHHFPDARIPLKTVSKLREFDLSSLNKLAVDISATIITTRGDIEIELYGNHAPSSVLNFIDLSQQNYYDDKFFHRVVPNFVVQAGCPRGDGYGSEDYAIRSELSPMRYLDEGFLGMASAGKHTESTQWFITHSPTPHLSGRYTIFGKVRKGMEVVQQIEVGDKILDIKIVNPLPAIVELN